MYFIESGHTAKAAYTVHFFQRGYSAHPQTLNYEGRKHTAPHTYTAEAAYTIQFFQRCYSTHSQILNYEGKKHIATHKYIGAIACATHFLLLILARRLLCTPTDSGLPRQETHSPPTHILLKQPVLHISCCTFLQQGYCKHYIYLCTPTDSELPMMIIICAHVPMSLRARTSVSDDRSGICRSEEVWF